MTMMNFVRSSKVKRFFYFFFLFLLIFLSCGQEPPYTVSIRSDLPAEGEEPMHESLFQNNPLPDTFRIIYNDDVTDMKANEAGEIDCTISIIHYSWRNKETSASEGGGRFRTIGSDIAAMRSGTADDPTVESSVDKTLEKTVRTVYYAPVSEFDDYSLSPSLTDCKNNSVSVMPLREISLPQKALPVDSLYPDDENYPLISRWAVTVSFDGEAEENALVNEWLNGLSQEKQNPEIIWIAATGDIMPGRGIDTILLNEENGIERIFQDTLPFLRSVDFLLGNLETTVTDRGAPLDKSYTFRVTPRVLQPLKSAGFDYFSLTNNHCWDYGEQGFVDTLRHLQETNLYTSGAGRNRGEASVPLSLSLSGQPLSLLSFGAYPPEMNGFDGKTEAAAGEEKPGILWADERTPELLSTHFSAGSFDIIMVHGGKEWHSGPMPYQKKLYREFIDHGADLVLGSHPHVLQKLESYKGKLIAYSLGNFLFPGMEETLYGEESIILRVGLVENAVRYVEAIPVHIDGRTIHIDRSGTILNRFTDLHRR